jgi:hypothetical protein
MRTLEPFAERCHNIYVFIGFYWKIAIEKCGEQKLNNHHSHVDGASNFLVSTGFFGTAAACCCC